MTQPPKTARRTAVWLLLIAAVFALCQTVTPMGRTSPDSARYLHYALHLTGESDTRAMRRAIDYVCDNEAVSAERAQRLDPARYRRPGQGPEAWHRCREGIDWPATHTPALEHRHPSGAFGPERMAYFFDARPGYPLLLAPFIAALGIPAGVLTASIVLTALGGVLAALATRTIGAPRPAVLLTQVLYYALPSAQTSMRVLAEGATMTLAAALALGCARMARGKAASGAALALCAAVAMFFVKYSQAMQLCAALAVGYGLFAVVRRCRARGGPAGVRVEAAVAAAAAALAAAMTAAVTALGWPSTDESLQDLASVHFTEPDVPDPWGDFLVLEAHFWTEWLRLQLMAPLLLVALALSAWALWRCCPRWAVAVTATAASGVLNQAAHPDMTSWGDRLIVLVWFLPLYGMPVLAWLLVQRRVPRPRPRPVVNVPPAWRHLARHLAVLSGSPRYTQYRGDSPPCDRTRRTPPGPPSGRTTGR